MLLNISKRLLGTISKVSIRPSSAGRLTRHPALRQEERMGTEHRPQFYTEHYDFISHPKSMANFYGISAHYSYVSNSGVDDKPPSSVYYSYFFLCCIMGLVFAARLDLENSNMELELANFKGD